MAYTTINKSSDHFNTVLYTGNGSTNAITGVGFQPDFVWIKGRSYVDGHKAYDAVRGVAKDITPNATNAEGNTATGLTAFDSDGFTLGSWSNVNLNNGTHVAWNWKANGSGSSNTDGSITSTVSANTTSGFSIVKWTGSGANATIGHGLGAVPKWIWVKSLANTTWNMIYHVSTGNDSELGLNSDNAASASSTAWQDTDPTSSVFYLSGSVGDGVNYSGDYIAYCFAEKKGFSKFGSYEGNGSTDGVFIYTGFKPAFVMIKSYNTAARNWTIQDNKRSSSGGPNPNDKWLYANVSDAEVDQASNPMDFLSNGFKLRNNGAYQNSNAYIYMAFAAAPLVGTNNIPATAR